MDYAAVVAEVRAGFLSGRSQGVAFRKQQLKALQRMYEHNEDEMAAALREDLRKPYEEAILFETEVLKNDISSILRQIDDWVKPEMVARDLVTSLDRPVVYREPYGVVLVLGAWNYPLQLALKPVAGAIAAGNAVILKPSEMAPASSRLMAKLMAEYLDESLYRVVEGGVPETTELLKQRFDYIFYTGSTTVGRIIHAAATKHLTPVTLELGGKSPVYLDDSVDLSLAVPRLVWGKLMNAGQTCIAPDYLLCSKEVQGKVVEEAAKAVTKFYGENPQKSPDFSRIINERHVDRLAGYMACGRAVFGGNVDVQDRYVAPTVLVDVAADSKVMSEEIFGPILPILNVDSVEDAVSFINAREKPLALYVFSNKKPVVDALLHRTSYGGATVNDVMFHFAIDDLPFGGVGESGMGAYHGKDSFLTFSHRKACLHRNYNPIANWVGSKRFPPFTPANVSFLKTMLRDRALPSLRLAPHALCFGLGVAAVLLGQAVAQALAED